MTMGSKLLLFTLLGMTAAYEYYLDIQTAGSKWAATRGPVYIELDGTKDRTLNFGAVNGLAKNSLKHFSKHSDENIGSIKCISFGMGSSDAWTPEYLSAWSSYDHEKVYVYSRKKYYSTDPKEGPRSARLCKEGDTTYTITATTSTEKWAASRNIRASVEIIGTKGSTETGIMDNFVKGKTETFVLLGLKDVGHVQCIVVKARGTDAWLFTKIKVQKKGDYNTPVSFYNVGKTWMSHDTKEGVRSLKLCNLTWTWY